MKLTKANLGVHVFVDNDSSRRHATNAIRVNGRFTEATDGFFLARVATPEPTDDPDVLIPKGTAASLEKSVAARKYGAIEEFADITTDGPRVHASTYGKNESTFTFSPAAGKFPNTQAIFHVPVEGVEFTLGAGWLQTVAAFVAKFGKNDKLTPITFAWSDKKQMMRFAATLKGDQIVSGVLMGVRMDKTFEQISANVPGSLPAKSKSMAAESGDENEPE